MDHSKSLPPPEQPPGEEPVWPSPVRTRAELDKALEDGFASGTSEQSHADIIAEARKALGIG